ncbi:MAG: hypothetical protein M1813_007259 [Trichoglossum hirsutum]|nr:MAG: hypothetical protein M1813_007259 [Trichoglossum hirsutum]
MTENIKPRDFYFLTEHGESPLKHQLVRFHPVHLGERHSTGRYKIIHKLGNGSVPTIWLARGSRKGQRASNRFVALKFISAASATTGGSSNEIRV